MAYFFQYTPDIGQCLQKRLSLLPFEHKSQVLWKVFQTIIPKGAYFTPGHFAGEINRPMQIPGGAVGMGAAGAWTVRADDSRCGASSAFSSSDGRRLLF